MNWSAQNLTAVIFSTPTPIVGSAFDTYRAIVGHAPKTFNESQQPAENTSHAMGPLGSDALAVNLQPGRINIVLSPVGGPPSPQSGPPVLADLDVSIDAVLGLAKKASGDMNPIRIALIANLLQPSIDKNEAVRLFRESTNISSIPDTAWDLQFGFNIKKPLGTTGWEMNRLCNWGIGSVQWMQVQMGPSGPSQTVAETAFFASMMAEMNTVPRANLPLGSQLAVSLFDDLADELKKVIGGGYGYLTSSS